MEGAGTYHLLTDMKVHVLSPFSRDLLILYLFRSGEGGLLSSGVKEQP